MVISEQFDNYLCIFTNLLAIFPSILFFLDKNFYDGFFTLLTGTISFIYHINNNSPSVLNNNIVDNNTIAVIDTIYSETLIINITTYVLLYKKHNIRAAISSLFFAIFLYIDILHSNYKGYIRYSIIGFFGLIIALKHIYGTFCKKTYSYRSFCILCFGAFLNLLELISFEELQNRFTYNFFHSLHHIFAFISIIFYFYVPLPNTAIYYTNKSRIKVLFYEYCNFFKNKNKIRTPNLRPITDGEYPVELRLIRKN